MSDERVHGTDRDDPRVAAVLAAAAAPAEAPLPGEAAALTAFRAAYPPAPPAAVPAARPARRHALRARENLRLIAAAVFGGVVMASGVATAATGGGFFGVHHEPKPAHSPAVHDRQSGDSGSTGPADEQPTTGTGTGTDGTATPAGTGSDTSSVATTTDRTGVDKGAEICTQASTNDAHPAGSCKAGEPHGRTDATTHGKPADPGSAATGHSKAGDHRQDDATTHGDATVHRSSTGTDAATTHSGGKDATGVAHRR